MVKQQMNNTALYLRLSRDDENYGDSISIETQRTILRQFVRENGFHVIDEYVDDGWSGTNFERPAFQRMIADIESGKVNCVITKDLSRFGREHVMMDYYLEFYFVDKKVRYIAVSDGEDTDKGLSDFVPFKNLFNEWFAKDTSRKVRNSLNAKFRAGERTFTYPPVGYKRHPDIKNKLMIDEETKWIIEKIFSLALSGLGAKRIANTLVKEKIPTPGYLNYKKYGGYSNLYADAPEEKTYDWSLATLQKILKDETYIGNTVHYRQITLSYKNKRKVLGSEDDLLHIENTHEPIISKDDFEKVQQMITSRRRRRRDGTTQIFAGLVRCSGCGWALRYGAERRRGKPYHFFNCAKHTEKGKNVCSPHYIRYDVLYAYVLSRIQYWSKEAQTDEEKLLNKLLKAREQASGANRRKQANELKKAEKRKAELDSLFARLYEDFATGRITEYNFGMLSAKYQNEQTELDSKITSLREKAEQVKQNESDAVKWVSLIKEYANPTELTAPLLNALIEKIYVHQAVKHEDGTKEQEVEIYYRFIGKID